MGVNPRATSAKAVGQEEPCTARYSAKIRDVGAWENGRTTNLNDIRVWGSGSLRKQVISGRYRKPFGSILARLFALEANGYVFKVQKRN